MTSPVPIDKRNAIIQQALPMLAQGVSTEIIGALFGIDGSTLRGWLITHAGPEAEQARADYLAREIARWQGEIENANDTIPLARAREGFRAAAWVAERRLPNLFGQKQQVEHKHTVDLDAAMLDARKALQARKVSTTYSVDTIEDAQIVGESDPNQA